MVYSNINMFFSLLALSLLFTICMFSSTNEGRKMLLNSTDLNSETNSQPEKPEEEEKVMIIGRVVGSRPPRCKGRCYSCGGHCVAVQVPTGSVMSKSNELEYARGEYSSDYKPITWKCKCGSVLFDP